MFNKIIILLIVLCLLSVIDYYAPKNKISELEFINSNRENFEVNKVNEDIEVYDKDGKKSVDYKANIENKDIIKLHETIDNITYCDNINELDSININDEIFMNDNYYSFTNSESFTDFNKKNNNMYEDIYIILFCIYIITILYILCE